MRLINTPHSAHLSSGIEVKLNDKFRLGKPEEEARSSFVHVNAQSFFLRFQIKIRRTMYFKFLMIAMMAVVFPFPSEASSKTCPRWVKLNKSPVCFGAKGNQYGRFSYHRSIFVSSFMLVHRSGKVSCNRSAYSYWGCFPNNARLEAILTDQKNKILAPEASIVNKYGRYILAGYTSSSSALVFCAPKKPHCVFANSELRLWHGEDLRDSTESDNGGKTCADVYGLLA